MNNNLQQLIDVTLSHSPNKADKFDIVIAREGDLVCVTVSNPNRENLPAVQLRFDTETATDFALALLARCGHDDE